MVKSSPKKEPSTLSGKVKKLEYKLIITTPVPYAPIGEGLAIVNIEMLQDSLAKAEKEAYKKGRKDEKEKRDKLYDEVRF